MKILCIGTLDKFSRFYLKIKESIQQDYKITNFTVYSLNFSGFLYTLVRLQFSCWLSVKAWVFSLVYKKKYLKIIRDKSTYKGVHYKKLIKFHLKLNETIPTDHLLLQTLAYIDVFDNIFINKCPDIILLIGDSRLSIETCLVLAKQYRIKIYFIEQGPFKTTFFDPKGVNANSIIRNIDLRKIEHLNTEQVKTISSFINRPKRIKYKRSPLYRGFDYIFALIFENTSLYPPDLKFTDTFPKLFNNSFKPRQIIKKIDKNTKSFLLILQVPMDVNMIYHSPNFNNHYTIIKAINESLPRNSTLIIREHPIYKGKYKKALYKYVEINELLFDTNASLKESLNIADVIIVNNSTVGIEAIAYKKPVIVLGNAYYDHPEICLKYNKENQLKDVLKKALDFKPKEQFVNAFLQEFLFNYLIDGFITDRDLNAPNVIAKKIIDDYNKLIIRRFTKTKKQSICHFFL